MKVLAMYLPQFHRTPENDEWWGEGFTEWTAVKDAECYFDGQVQPRKPEGDYYYNLLDKSTLEWQADLMHKYLIDGMCFYHYYFKNGRKILEKPAENLLRWKDIDMPFCFSWANETWARSWSKITSKNAWSTKIDAQLDMNDEKAILLEQQYGDQDDWKKHFEYLVQFFLDDRYIKVDGKPVFIIYKPYDIPCLVKMIIYWRELAKEFGFDDLFLIGVNYVENGLFDAVLLHEPQNTLRECNGNRLGLDSRLLWSKILSKPAKHRTYFCGFPGYDDTPRRGEGGTALSIINPKQFEEYMTRLISKGKSVHNEFTFINAWNEWGEGMYLEPDMQNGEQMLEAVKNAVLLSCDKDKGTNQLLSSGDSDMIDRYQSYWKIFDKWMSALENGKTVAEVLQSKGINRVAIYGLGMLGRHLLVQLENTNITVKYGIDRRGADEKHAFKVYKPEEVLPDVQMIIVSATFDFAKIYNNLVKKASCQIISLDELVEEMVN